MYTTLLSENFSNREQSRVLSVLKKAGVINPYIRIALIIDIDSFLPRSKHARSRLRKLVS